MAKKKFRRRKVKKKRVHIVLPKNFVLEHEKKGARCRPHGIDQCLECETLQQAREAAAEARARRNRR